MIQGKTIFSRLMDFLLTYEFCRCVDRYHGNYKVKSFSCWDQYLCRAFAQLNFRESLQDFSSYTLDPHSLPTFNAQLCCSFWMKLNNRLGGELTLSPPFFLFRPVWRRLLS